MEKATFKSTEATSPNVDEAKENGIPTPADPPMVEGAEGKEAEWQKVKGPSAKRKRSGSGSGAKGTTGVAKT